MVKQNSSVFSGIGYAEETGLFFTSQNELGTKGFYSIVLFFTELRITREAFKTGSSCNSPVSI